MKKIIFTIILVLLYISVYSQEKDIENIVALESDSQFEFSNINVNSERIGLYEKFEISFNLGGIWNNPYDPEQIRVDADFNMPDGKMVSIPGFFYQDYRINYNNRLEKVGEPVWKIRFTPEMTGEYTYQITAKNNNREIRTPQGKFNCITFNANHGFLKVSDSNPIYFEFRDGTPFFGIAMDRSQGDNGGSYRRFAESGGNFNRLFLTNGKFNIEELNPPPERPDRGLGKMNQEASWNLDKTLELGEHLGIYHMLTLTNQWTFNHRWRTHAYNKENGGILNSKNEYFTSEEAMEFFERHLRYMVARWGYSTSVFSWDLWNEYSAMGINLDDAISWHKRMAHYLDSVDIFNHVIHTNDGSFNGRDEMNALPEMDINSTNTYAIQDIAHLGEIWTRKMINQYKKPYVLTEFGMDHNSGAVGGYVALDPERRMVHNGLWSPLMSGSAATGMAWEGNWLDNKIFYTYLSAVNRIVHNIPFSKREWSTVDISSFTFKNSNPSYYSDVIVEGWPGNFRRPRDIEYDVFNIDKEGRVAHQESLNAVLTGKSNRRNTRNTSDVNFNVTYPVEGEFVIYVMELRDTLPTPQLTVYVDNKKALKKDLLPLNKENYNPIAYDQYYKVKVPGGNHIIHVENSGGGSIVTAFELNNYLLKYGPDLEVRGIQTNDFILLWLKNQKFTVLHELMNMDIKTQPEGRLELNNIPEGNWIAEWINTIDATLIKKELIRSEGQRLILLTPSIKESVAIRLQKI